MRNLGSKKSKINTSQGKSRQGYYSGCQGKLRIVGIGPGNIRGLSQRAMDAIEEAQVIVGYKRYIELIGDLADDKQIVASGMTHEIKRAEHAIEKAQEGKNVCLISSGDPGVYAMAGLVLELLSKEEMDKINIEIIPGIIAATSCASLLGAPLMHDFAVISLSDLLTDIELIRQRIENACDGDFVIVFYNPKSKNRIRPLEIARQILMKHKSPRTPVGIVRNAERENEEVIITTLKDMPLYEGKIDMATTIIVGNSQTYVRGKYMITPRGYIS